MILATAEALGADILYVGQDPWFSKVQKEAGLRVDVVGLPPFQPEAQSLPME